MARVQPVNNADVDLETLQDILEAARLADGRILLILGDPLLTEAFQGMTFARALIWDAATIYGLHDHLDEEWDCGICIGQKWALQHAEYPVYFAFLLGHELGHASTILTNLTLAAYEELVVGAIKQVSGRGDLLWTEFPHESRYDQFGLSIARTVYGEARVRTDLENMLSEGVCDDADRVRRALELPYRNDLRGIGQELAAFALPYKDDLISIWDEQRRRNRHGVAALLREFDWLWKASTS